MEADDNSVAGAGLPQLLGRFRRLVLKDKHTSHSEPTAAAAASDTDCGRPQSDPSGDIEQEQLAVDSFDTQEETGQTRMRQQNIRVERGNKVGTITVLLDVWIHSLKISKKTFQVHFLLQCPMNCTRS